MSPPIFLLVALAGGAGAALRWTADVLLTRHATSRFPWPILVINGTGSLALGVLTGASIGSPWLAVLGTGLLGGYTTFSTVCVDSAEFVREGAVRSALINTLGTFALCVVAAGVGLAVGGLHA